MPGVLVGIDDSKDARAALAWALRYARSERLPVTVMTVLDPLIATALWDDTPIHHTADAHLEAARRDVRLMVNEALEASGGDDDLEVSVRAVTGHPVKALVDAAADADILVVGSRGAGAFTRLLLGSTSSGVVHHASCTVVVVR
jgi:nucleotide-binding universal stress UspA family protein